MNQKKLAEERVRELFKQAETAEAKYADRYVDLARKIASKAQLSIPKGLRRMYCHNCYKYGKNASRRVKNKVLVVECNYCNNVDRYPFS